MVEFTYVQLLQRMACLHESQHNYISNTHEPSADNMCSISQLTIRSGHLSDAWWDNYVFHSSNTPGTMTALVHVWESYIVMMSCLESDN